MDFSSILFPPLKLLIFSLMLSSSLTETGSVALSGCTINGKYCPEQSTIPSSLAMLVLAPILVSTWIIWERRSKRLQLHRALLFDRNGGSLLKKKLSKRKRCFSIYGAQDMDIGTNKYSDRNVMQRCSPGTFYRATLESREVVVAKIPALPKSKIEQFVDEIIFLSLPHRNVVRLLGCCLETTSPLLIFELHGDGNTTLADFARFPCRRRAKAAAEAARGLAYLRCQNPRFFHGSVCSGNVLLDDGHCLEAKLFYSATSGPVDRGIGHGLDSEKSDVYSFGQMLVELLTCRTKEMLQESDWDFATWRSSLIEEEGGVLVKELADVAARCLSVSPEERPTLRELEAMLTARMTLYSD